MAIVYSTNTTGTLSPPDLLGIENIYAPVGGSLELSADISITLSPQYTLLLGSDTISILSSSNVQINAPDFITIESNEVNINSVSINLQGTDINLNANGFLTYQNALISSGLSTVEILALTPIVGSQVFNNTLNQMFFYQVSPITGTVLGWYNSTGTIKL